jgi:O-antigen/teichoic acid export membrane protein
MKIMTSLNRPLIDGAKWNAVKMLVITAVQFLNIMVIAKYIPPDEYGIYNMILVATGIALLMIDAGFGNAIIVKQENDVKKISSLFWINVIVGVLVLIILILFSPLVVWFFGEPRLMHLIIYSSLSILILSFGQIFSALAKKNLQFKRIALIEIVSNIAQLCMLIILCINNYGILSIIFSRIIFSILNSLLYFVLYIKENKIIFYIRIFEVKEYMSFGAYQVGERLANYLHSNIDLLIIGKTLGSEALGVYSLARQLMLMPIQKINPILIEAALPVITKIKKDNKKLNEEYFHLQKTIISITLPVYIAIIIMAPEFIRFFYGDKWTDSIFILQILCAKGILISLGNPINCILLTKERPDISFKWNIIAAIAMTFSVFIGVQWGINGVAITSTLFMICIAWPADFLMRFIATQAKIRDYFFSLKSVAIINSLYLIIMVIFEEVLRDHVVNNEISLLISTFVVGLLVYYKLYKFLDHKFFIGFIRIFLKER